MGDAVGRSRTPCSVSLLAHTSGTCPLPDTSPDHSAPTFQKVSRGRRGAPPPLLPHPTDPGALLVPLSRGLFAVVDVADGEAVGAFTWSAKVRDGKPAYAIRAYKAGGAKIFEHLHQFLWKLWGQPAARQLDHRDGDGLNCRRLNLRPATHSQNGGNAKVYRTNSSGFRGVCRVKNRWMATIVVANKRRHLGYFSSPEEAGAAYDRAAIGLRGEFARLA